MAKTTGARVMGLRLTLPGAPDTPHVVTGVPGLYRPGVPTPVGGDGEMPLKDARRLDKDPAIPLELVEVADPGAAAAAAAEALALARGAIVDAVRDARRDGEKPHEMERINDEVQAISQDTGGDD